MHVVVEQDRFTLPHEHPLDTVFAEDVHMKIPVVACNQHVGDQIGRYRVHMECLVIQLVVRGIRRDNNHGRKCLRMLKLRVHLSSQGRLHVGTETICQLRELHLAFVGEVETLHLLSTDIAPVMRHILIK